MLGNSVSVDVNIPVNLQKGLYSLDGFVSIDDSKNYVLEKIIPSVNIYENTEVSEIYKNNG